MAENRVTSVVAEVLSDGADPNARVTSVVLEVLSSVATSGGPPTSTGSTVVMFVVSE
jgi:hypothetical protein